MPTEFIPLPANLDFTAPYPYPSRVSPQWVMPGTLHLGVNQATEMRRGFEGRQFIPQFTMARSPGGSDLHEICGTRTYQNIDSFVQYTGEPVYFDERLYLDYVFNTTPGSYDVILEITGDVVGYPVANIGDSADKATFYGFSDDDGVFEKIGYVHKFSEVGFSYLDSKLDAWLGDTREFRQETQGVGLYWGVYGAHRSESDHGYYSFVSGIKISAQVDLRDDWTSGSETLVYGYDSLFVGRVVLVKRKNGPLVRDFGPAPGDIEDYELDAYRSGKEGVELSDLITEKPWLDFHGPYKRRDESAFDAIGYFEQDISGQLLPAPPAYDTDQSGKIGFLGKDGVTTYRITLEIGHLTYVDETEEFVTLETHIILVPPGEMADYLFSEYVESAERLRITKLESQSSPGQPFVEIELVGGEFNQTPTADCKVLLVTKLRRGNRWGHRSLVYFSPPDSNDQTFYLNKKTIRDLEAKTITAGAEVAEALGNRVVIAAPLSSGDAGPDNSVPNEGSIVGHGTPIVGGTVGNGTPIVGGHAGSGTSVSSGTVGDGKSLGNGTVGNGTAFGGGSVGRGTPIGGGRQAGGLRGGSLESNFELTSVGLQVGRLESSGLQLGGLQSSGGLQGGLLQSNFGIQGSRIESSGGLRLGNLQSSDGLKIAGLQGGRLESSGGLRGGVLQINFNLKGGKLQSGGLKIGGLKGGKLQSGGGLKSGKIASGGLRRRSQRAGGGKGTNASAPTAFHHIVCGTPVTGGFVLNVDETYDPDTGSLLPMKVNAFKAEINGKEWTPEEVKDWLFYGLFSGNSENTPTRATSIYTGGWSNNCSVNMDYPMPKGRIISIDHIDLVVPNNEAFSTEYIVKNSNPGTSIYAEEMIYLPYF